MVNLKIVANYNEILIIYSHIIMYVFDIRSCKDFKYSYFLAYLERI